MIRLREDQVEFYQPLNIEDPLLCKKAVAYTLTPVKDSAEEHGKWSEVTYYADPNADYSVSPLELMLKEWEQNPNN